MALVKASPRERFLLLARRRARDVEPEVRAAYLKSMRDLSASLPAGELERLIATDGSGFAAAAFVVAAIAVAFTPFRASLQRAITRAALTFARDLPRREAATVTVRLLTTGSLSPRVLEAIRATDTVVTERLSESIRGSVRTIVARGYERGQGPRATARELRQLIGLSDAELKQVENFRDALKGANGRRWEDYARRDRRFDGTIRKALESGKGLKPEQAERMVSVYAKRRLALSAEANARTATLTAYKQAQRAAWGTAVDAGLVDGARLMKEWIGVNDGRERPSHVEMNGTVVTFDALFPNGESIPGESTFNCRCWPRYFEQRVRT